MNEIFEYKTISGSSVGLFKDKGSKFIAYTFSVTNEDEIKKYLTQVKEKEYAARHHCYAYRIGVDGKKYRANDDGEPAHTAGDPILGQIDSFGLTQILIIVVRYFGGTKLGVGGLINAYRTAAKESLLQAKIVTKSVMVAYKMKYEYEAMNVVMRYVKQYDAKIIHQVMELSCEMTVELSKEKSSAFEKSISLSRKVDIEVIL